MENASKALLMAAGILIGLILLTAGMYLFNTIRTSQQAKYLNLSEEQILAYNAEFESYDKQRMYGTDVITVLNKAIDFNTQNEWYSYQGYQIDVTFRLETTVENYIVPYKLNEKTHKMEQGKKQSAGKTDKYTLIGDGKKIYSILNNSDYNQIEKFLKTQTEKSEIRRNAKKEKYKDRDGNIVEYETYYEIYYNGFSDFKRKIFRCTNVEYNNLGKISKMEFEEIPASELKSGNKLK